MLEEVPSRERLVQVGARRGDEILRAVGYELRESRVAAGLTLGQLASAVGITRQYLARIERASARGVSAVLLAKLFAVLGMRLSMKAYPAGPPLRDVPQVALLRRLQGVLPTGVPMPVEVPAGDGADGRAWDAQLDLIGGHAFIEAETRFRDSQALARRIALKRLSDPSAPVILLIADTKMNRAAIEAAGSLLLEVFPSSPRTLLRDLREGRRPQQSGIVFL